MMSDIFESLSCSKREDQLSEVRTRANRKKLEEGRYQSDKTKNFLAQPQNTVDY